MEVFLKLLAKIITERLNKRKDRKNFACVDVFYIAYFQVINYKAFVSLEIFPINDKNLAHGNHHISF